MWYMFRIAVSIECVDMLSRGEKKQGNVYRMAASENNVAVNTMLTAAMIAAAQYRRQHGQDGLTIISTTGVRTTRVEEAMASVCRAQDMTPQQETMWRANTARLKMEVLNEGNTGMLWFATLNVDQQLDVWQVPLAKCTEVFENATTPQ